MSPYAEPPINHLPQEILARILEFRELERDLVAATHVYRCWRAALISAPCLWTRIPCYRVDHTSTYLERSKSAPIDVLAEKTPFVTPIDSALELIIPHLERVRSMKISPALGGTLWSIFNFRSPAPLLQHLDICGYPSPLPVDFLGGHTPSLRSLRLGGRPPDLSHPPFHDVRVAQPQDIVWGLLSSSPLLQYISIAISDEEASPDAIPPHHIHLDSLHHLMVASGVTFSRVIPYIKAPRLKGLSLFLPFGVGDWTIAELLPSDSYPLMREVTTMDFRTGVGGSEITLKGEGAKVAVTMPYPDRADMNNFFNSTMASFSFTQITSLTFGVMAGPLALRIGEFTNLQVLNLTRCKEDAEIFSALSPSVQSAPLIPCPCLGILTIYLCDPTTHTVDSFKRMLRSRKEVGNPLMAVNLVGFQGREEIGDIDEWLGPAPVRE